MYVYSLLSYSVHNGNCYLLPQVFHLLKDINILVRKVQKVSKMRQEMTGLKKALADTKNFLESNQSLSTDFSSVVSARYTVRPQSPLGVLKNPVHKT
jgi:hypothetical protein